MYPHCAINRRRLLIHGMAININKAPNFYTQFLNADYYGLYQAALTALSKGRLVVSYVMPFEEDVFNQQIKVLTTAILFGHPELFFVHPEINYRYANGKMVMVMNSLYEDADLDALDIELNNEIDCIANELAKIDDKMEQLYKLNEYICLNYHPQDIYTSDNGNAYGVVAFGNARCEGFCKVASLVLAKLGIHSIVCVGDAFFHGQEVPHAWLAVSYNDKYYAFDYSYNASYTHAPAVCPVFTFLNKETVNVDRKEDFDYPICDDDSYLFWKMHHGDIHYISELGQADVIRRDNAYLSVHHLIDFPELSDYDRRYTIYDWIDANCAPFVRGFHYSYEYFDCLHILCVYYFND